ncbi:MAG TPA: hypothetical protein PKV16_06865 [Caldisericia bacterium]|nr:hypothetical protein [Caldisericia bacterium]HPF49488.1 hypothetical protein [Caldisericia bacterium]HPI84218.1 hypothetical protein [Caldisericia bacterium]HPQ93487.1 hypothetical protein [Caldisericia bacterium]HRV75507.1 hypothetical protein [Caldisericia bacterium]
MLKTILSTDKYDYITQPHKLFIIAFDKQVENLGYTCGGEIGEGFCWGREMIIYTKAGVKSKKSYARIYLRDDGIKLRFYFSKIDSHRSYIENLPKHLKGVFTGDFGKCNHCKYEDKKADECKFRKIYTIDNKQYEKCNGMTFYMPSVEIDKIPEYIELFQEFYSPRKRKSKIL